MPIFRTSTMRVPISRRGHSLLELLVVIFVILILLGLLFPIMRRINIARNESICQLNLKRLINAAQSYEETNGCLPISVSPWNEGGPPPRTGRGWIVEVLPYIGEEALYVAFEPSRQGDMFSGGGLRLCQEQMLKQLEQLMCPQDRTIGMVSPMEYQWTPIPVAVTNYKGVIGTSNMGRGWPDSPSGLTDNHNNKYPNGLFFRNSYQIRITLESISDGLSNTLAIGEDVPDVNHHGASFYANGDYASSHAPINYFPNPPIPDNWPRVMSFRSRHPAGVNFATADGSVRFVREDINRLTYQQLCTRAGGEAATLPDYLPDE